MLQGVQYIQPEAAILFLLPCFCGAFMFILWRRRARNGAPALLVLVGGAAAWSLGEGFELTASDLAFVVTASKFEYLGVLTIPPAWFVFSLQFAQEGRKLSRRFLLLLMAFPALALSLVFTNDWHHVIWAETWIATHGALTMLGSTKGPFYWLIVCYAYVLLLIGTAILIRSVIHRHRLHRKQAVVLLIMILAPLSANVVYQLHLSPIPYLDLTPMAFTICSLALTWEFLRYGLLFSRGPVSKDQIIQHMRDGVLLLDVDHQILDLNAVAQSMLGGESRELRGASIHGLIELPRSFTDGDAGSHGTFSVLWDESRAYEVTVSPFKARFAGVVGYVLLLRDVTERKRAEKALQESEARYRTLFNTMADSVLLVHQSDGAIADANEAGCNQLGYTREELLTKAIWEISTDAKEEVISSLQTLGAHERLRFEAIHHTKSGQDIPVDVHVSPVHYGADRLYIGIARDISVAKQAETELRHSEEKLAAIFNNSSSGIIFADLESGRVVDINSTMLRLLDCFREDVLGKTATELGLWADMAERATCLGVLRTHGRLREMECRVRVGNIIIPCQLSAEVVTINETQYGLWEVRDISEKKHAEEERDRLRAQLYESQKMESVGQLAGGIAHDFNNILAVILGYSEILTSELPPNSMAARGIEEIMTAGERARDLVRQLLAFSRRQILDIRVLDLNEIVTKFKTMLHRLIGEDVVIDIVLSPEPVCVKADVGQLEQVLLNLCVNARDAMSSGGTLRIETRALDVDIHSQQSYLEFKRGSYAVLSVTDTGHGMDDATREQIFDPFFTTKEQGKGTGLGLATVFGIIKQHGGEIAVESEVGRGSTFCIYLPQYREQPASAPVTEASSPIQGHDETLLVLEDDEPVRNMLCQMLRRRGYRVAESRTADECLELAGNLERVDLLITDVVMPGMNGKEVHDRVAEIRPELKVLFISGYPDAVIASRGVLEDGLHLLAKPFNETSLCQKVRELLDATH